MSTFRVEVVPVVLEPHPNADSLSLVKVFDGYTVCVRTQDWQGVDRGAYIPPESIVPNTEQFAFLEGHVRIKVKKLRGIQSFGMLVPAPEGSKIGDDVASQLDIVHYEPELSAVVKARMGEQCAPPPNPGFIYDIENWRKYRNYFIEGEEVVITEKIHGSNARFSFQGDVMYAGTHNYWRKPGDSICWKAIEQNPWIEAFCRLNPGVILYGEIFGSVQKGFNYGSTADNPYQFRAFDVFANGRFVDYDDALGGAESDFLVPVLYRGPYSHVIVEKFADGPSTLPGAKHIREGVVIKPVTERYQNHFGRMILKCVSFDYLEGKKK
jgi:RNA ligase (TIGR02306 family)